MLSENKRLREKMSSTMPLRAFNLSAVYKTALMLHIPETPSPCVSKPNYFKCLVFINNTSTIH